MDSDLEPTIVIDETKALVLKKRDHLYMQTTPALYLGEEIENVVHFQKGDDNCYMYSQGTDGALGFLGLLPIQRGASLIYPVSEDLSKYLVEMTLRIEKKNGEGFGSANGQYLELWMNYNTPLCIALRIEREVCSDKGCFISLREYRDNVNTLFGEKIFSNVFRKTCIIRAKYDNGELVFQIENGEKSVELVYKTPMINSSFMLRHTGTVGIGNRFVIQKIMLSYQKK